MPKISIVLVNYNHAQYLDERIQSLLNQTYKDFELIFIDNGSTDNSVDIIRKYAADTRIKTQFHPENVSPYRRWNEGVDLAQGTYLQIACADDSCNPTLLEKLSEKLDTYPSVDLAYSQCLDIDGDGNQLPNSGKRLVHSLDEERWSKDFVDSGRNECRYMFFEFLIVNTGAVLMRREAFIKAGKFDTQLLLSADHMLCSRLLLNANFAFVAEPLSYLRRHSNTMTISTKDDVHLEGKLQVIDFLLQEKVKPPESFWNTIYAPAVIWWIRLMTNSGLSLGKIYKFYRIYKLLRDIDSSVNSLMVKEVSAIFKRKFNIA